MELSEAAGVLGVHYQTAYRWVRDGSLSAQKVGTRYEIHRLDLEKFQAARNTPIPPPSTTRVRDWNELSSRFFSHITQGSEGSARGQVARLVGGGVDIVEVMEHLMAPALVEIGKAWRQGTLSVAVEHRAVRSCERILDAVSVAHRGRPREKYW